MGAFVGALGTVLEDRLKQRAMHSPVGSAIMGAYRHHGNDPGLGEMDRTPAQEPAFMSDFDNQVDAISAPTPPPPDPTQGGWATAEPMAAGKIVTQPTVALLGEHGAEKVTPLTNAPGQKVAPQLGMTGVRTAYRHVTGPNAIGHQAPIRNDLPLRPNNARR